MSHEGYSHCICEEGHHFIKGVRNLSLKCPICGSVVSFEDMVDERFEIIKKIEEGERDVTEGRTLSWEEVKTKLRKWRSDWGNK